MLDNNKILDNSKHKYNGIVYDTNNQTGAPSVYTIIIFDDSNMTMTMLNSDNLDTVIHMAETREINRKY